LVWNVLRNTKIDEKFQKPIKWSSHTEKTLKDYKFAWMDEWQTEVGAVKVSPETKEKLKNLIDSLNQQGSTTEKKAPDTFISMNKLFLASFISMMGQGQPWLIQKFLERDMKSMGTGSKVFESFTNTSMDGSDETWNKLESDRQEMIGKWEDFFKQYDFFIVPLSYDSAFQHIERGKTITADDGSNVAYIDYVPYACIFNSTGHPAITVPMGLNKKGLPIGIQIVGKYYSEPELLHLAKLLKPITPGFIKPKE
ncbi:MAG: amidase, partial [Pyrinomonadaceae bacterium]|nr:amidase [Pyrinomonadaceae bacterium]